MARKKTLQNASKIAGNEGAGQQSEQTTKSKAEKQDAATTTGSRKSPPKAPRTTGDGEPLFRAINLMKLTEYLTAWELGYERRVAPPEFRLHTSPAVHAWITQQPTELVELLMDLSRARMHAAETRLCDLDVVYVIGRLEVTIEELNSWWTSFSVGDLWFQVDVRKEKDREDKSLREYEIVFADGPSPPDTPKPTLQRTQNSVPPKRIGSRPRARKGRTDSKAARGSEVRAPQRKTANASREGGKRKKSAKRMAIALFKRGVRKFSVLRGTLNYVLAEIAQTLPVALRQHVMHLKSLGGNAVQAMCDVRRQIVQVAQRSAALVSSRHLALTSERANLSGAFASEARLESRFVGQVAGLNLILNSWIRIEPHSVDRDQGSSGIDWDLDIFGVPEEKQAFT